MRLLRLDRGLLMNIMWKSAFFILCLTPMGLRAQDLLEGLLSSQTDPSARTSTSGSSGVPVSTQPASLPSISSTASTQNCPSSGQVTIPLQFVQAMQRTRGASLQISHDTTVNRLHVKGGDFLSNCNGMLEWGLRNPTTQFPQYVVELKIKGCGSDSCPYSVMEKDATGSSVEKQISVAPTFEGFKQCLKETGVMKDDGGIDSSKMVIRDLDISFDRVSQSAPVWFGSHLPEARAVYRKQGESGCYQYEDIRQGGVNVYSQEDSERMRLDEQAQLICESGNYRHISDFIDRYGQYAGTLSAIRDELILKDYRDLAEKIRKDEDIESADFSVIADFQRYVVDPLTNQIATLHEEIGRLPSGSQERRAKEAQLQEKMRRLASFRTAPYIAQADVDKLMAKGLFDEASSVNTVHLTAQHFGRLGVSERGVAVTPRTARNRIQEGISQFNSNLVARRHEYEVKTGRVTGEADYYYDLAAQHRRNIQIRTANYQAEITTEAQRIQPPQGYCYRYFRNTQKCVNDSMLRINELREQLRLSNQADADIAADLLRRSNQYDEWEAEGRRYVASQSGEEEPAEEARPRRELPDGPSVDAPRADRSDEQQVADNNQYQFQFNNPLMQGQMPTQQPGMIPGQQQYNPHAQQQQWGTQQFMAPWWQSQQPQQQNYNPFMPQQQQGLGMQGQYSFNLGQAHTNVNPWSHQGMNQGYNGNIFAGQSNPYQWSGAQPQMPMGQGFGPQSYYQGGQGYGNMVGQGMFTFR